MTEENYAEHMNDLAVKVSQAVGGESAHDAAHVCAVIAIYCILRAGKDPGARQKMLEELFQFMRDTLLRSETEGTVQ